MYGLEPRRILSRMPRLWTDTIEAHRREVRDAIVETTAALVRRFGLRSVTMSRIAEQTGIGRATLYKYFPDVEAILRAWHRQQIGHHLGQLSEARERAARPARLRAVLEAYAAIARGSRDHGDRELAAFLHRDREVIRAESEVRGMLRDLIAEGAAEGMIRDDVLPDELATYCLHAIAAARTLPSKAAVNRLVDVTLDALRPGSRP